MSCDFEVDVKLMALDGTTLIFDLSDHEGGYEIADVTPEEERRERGETESPFVNGVAEVWSKDGAGRYLVALRLVGDSWQDVESKRLAARAAYRSASHYLLDVTVEGVTTRYRARRPDVSTGPITANDLVRKKREILLSFPVQPNPIVTGV